MVSAERGVRAFGEGRDAERAQRRSRANHPLQTDGYLAKYYARRAPEMEEAFECTGRAADIAHLRHLLPEMVEGLDVVEIACGTGFWTQSMAERARSITATDIAEEMLGLARAKTYPGGR